MNEVYEFMKQVDVIVLFCLIYGLAINGIGMGSVRIFQICGQEGKSFYYKTQREKGCTEG